ncbi:hypothetical protein PR048_006040 [Dryococelus australis]|uniref:Uncharacterized protein n=1 Tax=Dryococelus australis TaxID=614101 RepID=A0ABQ9I9V9_9NEOP|nr:hypothetical protein PR048_006040 [Dryococelus australis]
MQPCEEAAPRPSIERAINCAPDEQVGNTTHKNFHTPVPPCFAMGTGTLHARADGAQQNNGTTIHSEWANNNVRHGVICTKATCERAFWADSREVNVTIRINDIETLNMELETDDIGDLGIAMVYQHVACI